MLEYYFIGDIIIFLGLREDETLLVLSEATTLLDFFDYVEENMLSLIEGSDFEAIEMMFALVSTHEHVMVVDETLEATQEHLNFHSLPSKLPAIEEDTNMSCQINTSTFKESNELERVFLLWPFNQFRLNYHMYIPYKMNSYLFSFSLLFL